MTTEEKIVYVPVEVSTPPEKEGRYIVQIRFGSTDIHTFEADYSKEFSFHEEFTDCSGITHWLRPVTNLYTEEEMEKRAVEFAEWSHKHYNRLEGGEEYEGKYTHRAFSVFNPKHMTTIKEIYKRYLEKDERAF